MVRVVRALVVLGVVVGVSAVGARVARGRATDDGVLNQTTLTDATGDEHNSGADISSMTITSYADNTISFVVSFANRDLLHPEETAQIFVDVNDDGHEDLNLSIWPNGEPSYLDRWSGSAWENVRQLPEVVETNGHFSERISLDELRGAAALEIAPTIEVVVATWSGNDVNAPPDDALPDGEHWASFQIQPSTTTTTTTTTTP